MTDRHGERRTTARHPAGPPGALQARIRPGHAAAVVNVSAGGVLIETSRRLLPGTFVEISMQSESQSATRRGRVLRCAVIRLRPDAVHYRAAVQFDSYLPWFVDEDECVGAAGVAGQAVRAATTPPVW
jgi:hypothetical protein